MFCPNCGTKNEEAAEKCASCGFDLQAKKASAKFKGTMMMQASPVPGAAPGTAGTPRAASPATPAGGAGGAGTGLAAPRPATPGLATPGAAAPGAASPAPGGADGSGAKPAVSMKGTMVGLAPPGMEELRRQLAEATQQGKAGTATPAARAAASNPSAQSKLKGTMLGVAPQNAAADPAPAPGSPSEAATPAAQRPAPSALKGTMIGVAPPSVAALRNAAAQPASGDPQSTSPLGSQLKSTMLGSAPPEGAGASPQAPAGVNPLGGTMVGTSPFHSPTASTGKPALTPAPPRDVENEDISQDSGVFEPVASAASALMSSHPSSHDLDAEPAPAFDATDATPAEPYRAPQRSASPASPPQFSAPAVRKSNAPVILLIGVILVICLLLAAFVL